MSHKKTELKVAIQSLKVHESLKLTKNKLPRDFGFQLPTPSEISLSADENLLRSNASEINTIGDENNLTSKSSEMISNSEQFDPRLKMTEIKSILDESTLRLDTSPIEKNSDQNDLSPKPSPMELGLDKNRLGSNPSEINSIPPKKDEFDLIPFIPAGKRIALLEHGEGTFNIPHRIYEFIYRAIETKVEILVFSCLLRYTLGFQRSTCKASQSFIAQWTGIAVPNVRKTLKSLLNQGLIVRLEEGNLAHAPAMYEVPLVKAFLDFEKRKKRKSITTEPSGINPNSDQKNLTSNRSKNSDQIDPGSEIDLIPKKEKLNKIRNKTLSPDLPESLKGYFSNLAPFQKRERELKIFQTLQSQFELNEIGDALCFVLQNGDIQGKEPVHSPMAYLSFSMSEILGKVRNLQTNESRRQEEAKKRVLAEAEKALKDAAYEQELQEKEQAFKQAFSTQEKQLEVIHEICKRNKFDWAINAQIARSIAIQTWWEELRSIDQSQGKAT